MHVTNTIAAGSDGRFTAFLFTLVRPLMRWLMRRRLGSELDELKATLEGGPNASGSTAIEEGTPTA